MKILNLIILGLLLLPACDRRGSHLPNAQDKAISLTEARRGFETTLGRSEYGQEPVAEPPPQTFQVVHYDSPAGRFPAYLMLDPKDGKKHPALIWITGGDCNTIGDVWSEAPASNDQTASAFRKAGIVMMFPSLRGGNENPGAREGFFGEVQDVLSAAEFLGRQQFVDPNRIYLGGHSTGGTLALLVAECSDRFRAVFSFGPVAKVEGYPPEFLPFDTSSRRELELRAPIRWLHSIKSPVFVFEGTRRPGNLDSLKAMARATTNPMVHFFPVSGADHFSILAPTTQFIAESVLRDDGPVTHLAFNGQELNQLFGN